ASEHQGARPGEAPRRTGAAAVGGLPRDRVRDGQGVAGGDGAVAGPAEPGRGGEPAGGPGGDADGGAGGRVRGGTTDAGDDQPDRERALGDTACDGSCDAVA